MKLSNLLRGAQWLLLHGKKEIPSTDVSEARFQKGKRLESQLCLVVVASMAISLFICAYATAHPTMPAGYAALTATIAISALATLLLVFDGTDWIFRLDARLAFLWDRSRPAEQQDPRLPACLNAAIRTLANAGTTLVVVVDMDTVTKGRPDVLRVAWTEDGRVFMPVAAAGGVEVIAIKAGRWLPGGVAMPLASRLTKLLSGHSISRSRVIYAYKRGSTMHGVAADLDEFRITKVVYTELRQRLGGLLLFPLSDDVYILPDKGFGEAEKWKLVHAEKTNQ